MLKIYIGPMFSGKTEAMILDFLEKYEWVKPGVYEWFRPEKDTRTEHLNSRALEERGLKIPFHTIKKIEDIDNHLTERTKSIYIDEGNFLEGDPLYLHKLALEGKYDRRIDVHIGGLVMTSEQEFFSSIMPSLLPYATDIETFKAQCVYCGEPAPYTYNIYEKIEKIVVGDTKEGYEAVCEECLCYLRRERGQALIKRK